MQRETWAILLVLLLAGGVIFVHVTTTTEEYSRYNIGWNGTSDLAAEEVRDLRDLSRYPGATLLILAPDQPFTPEDVGYLRMFLDDGGHVLIADEEGTANPFLEDLRSTMRVRPGNFVSLDRDRADPGLFVGHIVENAGLFTGVETILLNRPAAVEGGDPLFETSVMTWEDLDRDGRPGGRETFGTVVVCAHEGNLSVLGDSSLFINAMLEENPKFIQDLQPLLIDGAHSRIGTRNSFINTLVWARETPLAASTLAALAVLPVACWFGRRENV